MPRGPTKFIIIALFVLFGIAPKAKAVPLGPFDITIGLCKDVQYVSSVVNAWASATFPVTGTPGFVTMMIQNTNPILDLCSFIVQLSVADTTSAIFLTADKLNNITQQKWNDHLNLLKQTYKIANSTYDFNSGKHRTGTIEATSMAADLGTWQRMVTELSTGNNPQAVKQREENDRQIQQLANAAHQRAILKEGTTCPAPANTSVDFDAVVASTIRPNEVIVSNTEKQLAFLKSNLLDAGPQFISGITELENYRAEVLKLFSLGYQYSVATQTQQVQTSKPTGTTNSDGTAVRTQQPITQTIQVFTVFKSDKIFSDFLTKYDSSWRGGASIMWDRYSSTADGMNRLQKEYSQRAYRCNEATLMVGYANLTGDEYEAKLVEQFKQCYSDNKVTKSSLMNLLSEYVNVDLPAALYANKKAHAENWSLESKYLGRQRSVSVADQGNYFQESVVCEKTPEQIDLEVIQTKQAEVNAQYNEIIARESVKNAMLRDEELRQQAALSEDNKRKRDAIEKKKLEENTATETVRAPNLGGSF